MFNCYAKYNGIRHRKVLIKQKKAALKQAAFQYK